MAFIQERCLRGGTVLGAVDPEWSKPSQSLNDTRLQGTPGKTTARGV